MRETLYIRLRDTAPDAPTAHALVATDPLDGGAGRASVFVRELPLDEVIALAAGRRVVVFVPGVDVRLTTVTVPVRQPAKVLQAAPFVLEDQFAEDVDTLHFAIGARQAGRQLSRSPWWPAAQVDEWLAPFTAARVRVAALVPDTLALPWQNDDGSVERAAGRRPGDRPQRPVRRLFGCVPDDFRAAAANWPKTARPAALRILVVACNDATDYTRPEPRRWNCCPASSIRWKR